MFYDLNVTNVVAVVPALDDLPEERVNTRPDNNCYNEGGEFLGGVRDAIAALLGSRPLAALMEKQADDSHTSFLVEVSPVETGDCQPVFIEKIEPRRLRRVVKLEVYGTCRVRRARFSMLHGAFGPVRVAWGTSVLDGRKAMMVAVQPDANPLSLTLHLESSEPTATNE